MARRPRDWQDFVCELGRHGGRSGVAISPSNVFPVLWTGHAFVHPTFHHSEANFFAAQRLLQVTGVSTRNAP
jgi:hypothetical protein